MRFAAALWTTLVTVPLEVRDEWKEIFLDCVCRLLGQLSLHTLSDLFLASKGLLATVRHGGNL